jgi:hypothetical protein
VAYLHPLAIKEIKNSEYEKDQEFTYMPTDCETKLLDTSINVILLLCVLNNFRILQLLCVLRDFKNPDSIIRELAKILLKI